MYALQQQVEGLQAAADDADTLRLEVMEARREVQELQQHQRRWDLRQREEAAAQARRLAEEERRREEEEEAAVRAAALERQRWRQQQILEVQREQEAAAAAAASRQQQLHLQRRQAAEVHPYDAAYHPGLRQQVERQQGLYYGQQQQRAQHAGGETGAGARP